ncbi:hypothetical protein F2981_00870 [Sinorhizobium meliloti]|nr:hypothetical protein [Sinorhizobium meliloti]
MPILTERLSPYLALCTDDRNPLDIAEQGHLDPHDPHGHRAGVEPLAIYRAASISAAPPSASAIAGLVAPGWRRPPRRRRQLENCKAELVLSPPARYGCSLRRRKPVRAGGLAQPSRHARSSCGLRSPTMKAETSVLGRSARKIITEHADIACPPKATGPLRRSRRDIIKSRRDRAPRGQWNHANGFVQAFG